MCALGGKGIKKKKLISLIGEKSEAIDKQNETNLK
jgi:hypothetical protein